MRLRISVGWMMCLVGVVALDMGLMKSLLAIAERTGEVAAEVIACGVPLPVGILVVGALIITRDLIRRGECGPFLAGFVVCGLGVLFLFEACAVVFASWFHAFFGGAIRPILRPLETNEDALRAVAYALLTLLFSLRQLLVALVGGALNQKVGGFTVVTMRRLGRPGVANGRASVHEPFEDPKLLLAQPEEPVRREP
jgi:hypothetical protein